MNGAEAEMVVRVRVQMECDLCHEVAEGWSDLDSTPLLDGWEERQEGTRSVHVCPRHSGPTKLKPPTWTSDS